ncbi:MAG: hypothetical protein IIZ64_08200 [Erysipelotrichaceae bacterium]|nr:hypothetical protein [Erysipelotrichaceae bacterium]
MNDRQLQAIRFYEGDVYGEDPFWSDPKAYVTLNSLFFEGVEAERRRAREKKYLNPEIIKDPVRLFTVLKDLLSAFRPSDKERITYRVERYDDYLEMKQKGRTVSFTSTSLDGFLKEYGDRIGIALMIFHIPENAPVLAFSEVLKEGYLKAQENEILLPPGLSLEPREIPLNEEDLEIKDALGNPPIVKCEAFIKERNTDGNRDLSCPVCDTKGPESGTRVYEALNGGKEADPEDIKVYTEWKKSFIEKLL